MTSATVHPSHDVHIRRVFNAPRARVFAAFADAEQVVAWFGPRAYPAASWTHDFTPGGAFEYEMRGPNGESAPGSGEYVEIVDGERIVSLSRIIHDGTVIFEVRQTMTFADAGGATELSLEHTVLNNDGFPGASGAAQGWSETLDRLDEYLLDPAATEALKKNALVITRTFHAPPERVYAAWTQPELFSAWWGTDAVDVPLETVELNTHVGGRWAAVMHLPDGGTINWCGEYTEVDPPRRLAFTMSDDPARDSFLPVVVTFTNVDTDTRMTLTQTGSNQTNEQHARTVSGYNGFFDTFESLLSGATR